MGDTADSRYLKHWCPKVISYVYMYQRIWFEHIAFLFAFHLLLSYTTDILKKIFWDQNIYSWY